MSARILIVEDEQAIALALSGLLRKQGHDVAVVHDAPSAIAKAQAGGFDLILTDLALGRGGSGMDVLAASREAHPGVPVLMITAHGSEKIAVQAIKAGAEDYVPKPFDNDEIRLAVSRALDRTRLARDHKLLLERVQRDHGFDAIVGSGRAMGEVFELIRKAAPTDLTVLIRGESGTGKELVAQALHDHSPRRDRPFVAVNCAAISRELVESELFGHERGAFTGADARRMGRFEAAEGGSLFLDEIGDMPMDTQAKVLRVLQERTVERVGGNRTIAVDVRIIAASHRDLEREVEEGRYRQDLYYRLRVIETRLPPLRERREDIPALGDRFLDQLAARLDRPRKRLSAAALAELGRHDWPGNVRELKSAVERAAVLATGDEIEPGDLDLGGSSSSAGGTVGTDIPFSEAKKRAVTSFERAYLSRALRENDGNISRTAAAIGMVRQSLQQKIRELGLRKDGE